MGHLLGKVGTPTDSDLLVRLFSQPQTRDDHFPVQGPPSASPRSGDQLPTKGRGTSTRRSAESDGRPDRATVARTGSLGPGGGAAASSSSVTTEVAGQVASATRPGLGEAGGSSESAEGAGAGAGT